MSLCDKIDPFLNKALPAADVEAMQRHVAGCRACGDRLADWQAFEIRLQKWAAAEPVTPPSPVDAYALMRRAVSHERPRSFSRMSWVWISAAAATACAAAVLVAVFWGSPDTDRPVPLSIRIAEAGGNQSVAELGPNDAVEAPPNGHRVAFIEKDAVGLSASTKVRVLRAGNNKTRLRLEKGTVSCKVAKRHADGEFVVEAGGLTVRVVGTRFSVTRDETGDTRVTVEEGRVAVTDASGKTAFLGAGQGIEADINGKASAPKPASQSNLELTTLLLDPEADIAVLSRGRATQGTPDDKTKTAQAVATEAHVTSIPEEAVDTPDTEESDTEKTTKAAPPLRKWQEWIMTGRTTEAASAMRRYLGGADDPAVWALLADCERKEGDYRSAAKAYEKVIARGNEKQRARALYMLGSLMQSQLGDHVRALKLFETYKVSAHGAPELMRLADANIIRSLVALKRCKEAETTAERIQGGGGAVVSANIEKMLEVCRAEE